MNCRHAAILIQRSLDNALPAHSVAALDAHLAVCPRCQKSREEYRQLGGATTAWLRESMATHDPGDLFSASVMARLDARPVTIPVWPRLAAVGIALVTLLVLSMTLGIDFSRYSTPALLVPHFGGVAILSDWLASQLGQLPHISLDILDRAARSATASPGIWAAFTAALCVNVILFLRSTHLSRRQTAA